ncbi:hypothetical protein LWI29_033661 [Acer saccharum]|uniref:C3H1-type domain-containing protein n=1 Tax=Acer saccharum TaxID=4024 RepID=A0AA39SZ57_ACESA|nr:hypothetical protein LWI29_033661 [Acer saccharum]
MNNPAMESTVYKHNQPHILAAEFPAQPGQPECSYFLKTGDCKFKSNCIYHHPKNQISNSLPCALSDKGLPLRPETILKIILKMEVLLYVGSKIKILAVAIVPKEKASTLFLKYLSWKQSFVPNGYISPSEITNQFEDNKVCMKGLDKKGRPIVVAFGGRHNPSKGSLEDFNRFVVFTLDKVCAKFFMKKVGETKSGNATGSGGGTANNQEPSLVEGASSGASVAENVGGGEGRLHLSSKRTIDDVALSNYYSSIPAPPELPAAARFVWAPVLHQRNTRPRRSDDSGPDQFLPTRLFGQTLRAPREGAPPLLQPPPPPIQCGDVVQFRLFGQTITAPRPRRNAPSDASNGGNNRQQL